MDTKKTKKGNKGKAKTPVHHEEDEWEDDEGIETQPASDAPTLYDLLNVPKTATVADIVLIFYHFF